MIAKRPVHEGGAIRLGGVRQNNLKGIDADIPLGKLTVITGVSGSGKSSLAFDTLYAEGQRRYVETFSSYTRQFLDRIPRPDADLIEGIPPAVAIDQSGAIKTSRSTVGTLTGVNDYLKLLFARAAEAWCPRCDVPVRPEGTRDVVEHIRSLEREAFPVFFVASVPLGGFDSLEAIRAALSAQGYVRFLRAGEAKRLEELSQEDLRGKAVEVVVDRLASPGASRAREADSALQAFRIGRGSLRVISRDGERRFAEGLRCAACSATLAAPTPGLFSFNNPFGACPECRGFGRVIELDLARVIPDAGLTLAEGAIKPFTMPSARAWQRRLLRFAGEAGIATDRPFSSLPAAQQRLVVDGGRGFPGARGFFRRLERKKYKMHVRVLLARYRGYETCPACGGGRLRPEASSFRLRGRTLPQLWGEPVRALRPLFEELLAEDSPRPIRLVIEEVASRLRYLDSVGLGYLTLGRQARTLSGGEVERVNLTSALGASLVNTLFILDEPSIGLHARDNDRLLGILREIRDRGNTVVVVEHDPAIIREADHIIDVGPGSGEQGGRIVAAGSLPEVLAAPGSLTADHLSGRRRFPRITRRSPLVSSSWLRVRGATANNLQDIDVDLPLGVLCVLSGVSGSGKSTLLEEVLWRSHEEGGARGARSVDGFQHVSDVVLVDQSPIGRTPRGNPATYTKVHDLVRALFAASPDARARHMTARHFSFNVEGGRCEECAGAGAVQVEMQFLSDVTLPCEACGGRRFRDEVLQVRWRGMSIDQVLRLTVAEASALFEGHRQILEKLGFLESLGLGYLALGQPIHTLSGGEAQRLKLAGRVMAARHERLLFLLDEPTTGLHLEDVLRLVEVLRSLTEAGHSVIMIEHHLDVLASADWIVDLGPEGGDGGGRLMAQGKPEDIVSAPGSVTGAWLSGTLALRGGAGPPGRGSPGAAQGGPRESSRTAGERVLEGAPCIRVIGARENNLKNISVDIPRDELVVVTGLSGSGKSSLLYDIVFAEGQRRYLDCLSPYARQFVEDLHRPDIDHLEGIPPTVAIEQRTSVGGRKSTVGTVTEVYQLLRLLYARAGIQRCPQCDVDVAPRRPGEIVEEVARLARRGGRLLAPVVRGKKGFHHRLLAAARRRGVLDARIDGDWIAIPEGRELRLERHKAHDIDLVVERFRVGAAPRGRLEEAVRRGLAEAGGHLRFLADNGVETVLSLERSCPGCGRDFEELDPRSFSFHSRHGACAGCDGYGMRRELDLERLVSRWDLPLEARPGGPLGFLEGPPFAKTARARVLREARAYFPELMAKPLVAWPARAQRAFLEGAPGCVAADGRSARSSGSASRSFGGLLPLVAERLAGLPEDEREERLEAWGRETPCEACLGGRLRQDSLAVRIDGAGIAELTRMSIDALEARWAAIRLEGPREAIGRPILDEVASRLEFLRSVGLGYLTLDRASNTLSTGEAQRIRLAAQLGSSLRGVCYILDEPTIGLHSRDSEKLIATLRALRDEGNSVLVVEHDEATIEAADTVLDMGPGPGKSGGEVVARGTLADLIASEASATGAYFRKRSEGGVGAWPLEEGVAALDLRTAPAIEVLGASRHNLRGIDARFPIGALTVVTGVSGAGKSTLVRDVLEESVRRSLRGLSAPASGCRALRGADRIASVREVDQLPIGRTPRSTPATYVGLWNRIRSAFASLPEARARGYDARRFSFNAAGGRCETCAGQGRIKMEMSFLPDVSVDCEACGGRRFGRETEEVLYRGKSISDVLAMSVDEAAALFEAFPELSRALKALSGLGLGYLTLGQHSTTLSGGEAQRVKLAVELSKSAPGACLYLLDEPTTGLHLLDVERLVDVLGALARAGHAVVVIEHHLDVVRRADWVIDLGPEAGEGGGRLLYAGPPAGLRDRSVDSATARALRGETASGERPGRGSRGAAYPSRAKRV